jgi:antitoxin MazE
MNATVQKWGNSLALRIPKSFAEETHLRNGSVVDLAVHDGKLIIEPAQKPQYNLSDLLKKVTKENLHSEVSTGPTVGREIL